MTLSCIDLDYARIKTPSKIVDFLNVIEPLVEQHRVNTSTEVRGFVPSDYKAIYSCLRMLYDSQLLCGDRFCEWGSGVGVVASLAAMVGFESYGIEYDADLFLVAKSILEDFDIPVTLVNGSFIPDGVQDLIDEAFLAHNGELSLHTHPDGAYSEIGCDIQDFDVIFAYPWPNDVELTHKIFDRCAAQGAMFMANYDDCSISLHRKK